MKNAEKYPAFDMRVLDKKKKRIVSSEEALKEIIPINWSSSVLSGEKKVIIKNTGANE